MPRAQLSRAVSQLFVVERNDARGGAYEGDGSRKILLVPAARKAGATDKDLDGAIQVVGNLNLLVGADVAKDFSVGDELRLTLSPPG